MKDRIICVLILLISLSISFPIEHPLKRFVEVALNESDAYDRLAYFTDTFGSRFTGSDSLERAIDWVYDKMIEDGTFDKVQLEDVKVPIWSRGEESAKILSPRASNLTILGLGMAIGTSGVTGEVIAVSSFEELAERANEVPGKIVLLNVIFTTYPELSPVRKSGAVEAAKYGAIGCLMRSVGPWSLNTPHTGSSETSTIPYVAVTLEDADLIQRYINRGEKVIVEVKSQAKFLPDGQSRNIVADYHGYLYPEQVIVIGGHIDSWDVGTGALDDGGGVVVSWECVRLMKIMGIRPKRTIRVVMWTNEENGAKGSDVYFENREHDMDNHIFALESDGGVFSARGIGFTGSEEAYQILVNLGQQFLSEIGAGNVTRGGGGRDIDPLCNVGVPCAGLNVANGEREDKTDVYFNYHHTYADTMSLIRKPELDSCVAGMGVWAFGVADLDENLPRDLLFASREKYQYVHHC